MKKNLLVAFMLVVAGNTFAKTAADTLVVTTLPVHAMGLWNPQSQKAYFQIGAQIINL